MTLKQVLQAQEEEVQMSQRALAMEVLKVALEEALGSNLQEKEVEMLVKEDPVNL